jgi:hypothetical protein
MSAGMHIYSADTNDFVSDRELRFACKLNRNPDTECDPKSYICIDRRPLSSIADTTPAGL